MEEIVNKIIKTTTTVTEKVAQPLLYNKHAFNCRFIISHINLILSNLIKFFSYNFFKFSSLDFGIDPGVEIKKFVP